MFSEDTITALRKSVESGTAAHGPVSVQVLPSGTCNAECVFCPIHSRTIPLELKQKHAPRLISQGGLLDFQLYREFIDDLKELGLTKRIQYTGLGDPLVHPKFVEMVSYARAQLPNCSLIVVTNGIYLKKYCRELVDSAVDEISVSLNAGKPETWAALNRKGTEEQFHAIIEALEYLGRIKNSGKPRLTITAVLSKHNYDDLRDLLTIAQRSKSAALTFIRMMVIDLGGVQSNRDLLCSPDQFRKFDQTLEELKANASGVYVGLCGIGPDDGSLDTAGVAVTAPCYAGWTFALLYPDGSIYPCCMCETSLGNVAKARFKDIWRSTLYSSFRTRVMRIPQLGVMPGCLCNECGYYYENQEYHRLLSLQRKPGDVYS